MVNKSPSIFELLERIIATVVVTGIFIVWTIIGLSLVFLSYKLLQEGTMAIQMFGFGIGLVGVGLLAKIYRSLGRISWGFAEWENERG